MVATSTRLPEWQDACGAALVFARDHSRVNAGRLGVLGFSLGAHIALTLGMAPPRGTSLKCVVDFFGPVLRPPLRGDRKALPPVLIHHGELDHIVDLSESEHLVTELRAAGKTEGLGYKFIKYARQAHGFDGPDLDESRSKTIEFLTAAL